MPLKRLVYVSRPTSHITEMNVQRIQWSSQVRNRRLDITGMLVFTGRHFAQVLEGREGALNELMLSVRGDPRHGDIRVLLDQRIDTRLFDGWAMTYASRYEFADELEALLGNDTVSASDVEHLMQRLFFAPP